MIWFIDIDGCLCNNWQSYIRRSKLWLDNNMIKHTEPNINVYNFGKMFGVDDNLANACYESEEFAGYYIEDPMDGAVEFMELLDEEGFTIIILTSRTPDLRITITPEVRESLGNNLAKRETVSLQVLTQIWLETHKIPYDNIVYREDKASFMKDFPTGVAIEDSPSTINKYVTNGTKFIRMGYPFNEDCTGLVADNWLDINRMHKDGIV